MNISFDELHTALHMHALVHGCVFSEEGIFSLYGALRAQPTAPKLDCAALTAEWSEIKVCDIASGFLLTDEVDALTWLRCNARIVNIPRTGSVLYAWRHYVTAEEEEDAAEEVENNRAVDADAAERGIWCDES